MHFESFFVCHIYFLWAIPGIAWMSLYTAERRRFADSSISICHDWEDTIMRTQLVVHDSAWDFLLGWILACERAGWMEWR